MAPYTLLLISATVWTLGLALPLQSPQEDGRTALEKTDYANDETGSSAGDSRTFTEVIKPTNKGIPKLLTEGGIVKVVKRSAMKCANCKWRKSSDGIVNVPYVFSSIYTDYEKQVIMSALQEFSVMTCVQFKNRTTESDYLSIVDGRGCWSYIGRIGGPQTVSLSRMECIYYGIVQHEAMHNIGSLHEHTRSDRDKHVEIQWQYVSANYKGDFQVVYGDLLDLPYDYTSVMHYSKDTFTNTYGMSTIVPIPDPSVSIGQRDGLSTLDVKKINKYYNCKLCRTKVLGASGRLFSGDVTAKQYNDSCLWLIQVPSKKVLLQVDSFNCSSSNCSAEIYVYDGANTASPLLAKIRPGLFLPLLVSTSKFIVVEYRRDNSIPSKFDASYSSVLYGSIRTKNNGNVISPNYPRNYLNNVNGIWNIITPPGYRVSLTFPVFDVESSPSCSSDYLTIRDGGGTTAPILGTYCGNRTGLTLMSTGRMILLQFSSNLKGNGQGFQGNYSFVSTE